MRELATQPQPTADHRARFGRSLNLDRIENALRAAEGGRMRELTDLEYETLNVDPHLAAVLGKRIGAVATLAWDVTPAEGEGVDPELATMLAEFVREQLATVGQLQQAIRQLAWGFYHGRAALEIKWRPATNREPWRVEALKWVHPRWLAFGPERELRYDTSSFSSGFAQNGFALRDIRWKFLEFQPQLFGDYPEREGLGPRCLYWSFFKRFANRERMILVELFGKPWRIVEVDEESSANADDLLAAEEAAIKLGGATTARMPRGTKLNIVAPNRAAGQIHQEVIEEADRQLSKLILGQTATTEAGGSVPGADGVLRGEQLVILQHDARLLGEAIETYLTDAIVALNFGEENLLHAPRFRFRSEIPADKKSELERMKLALDCGVEIKVEEAYAISGFTRPKDGDVVIRVEQPPAHPTAVQPPAPRPIIVYPPEEAPDPGEVKSIPGAGDGGLDSLEEPPEPSPPPAPPGPPAPPAPPAPETPPEDGEAQASRVLAALTAALGPVEAYELWLASHGRSPWEFDVEPHVCLAKQPDTVNGSPEAIIEKGVERGARETARWADDFARAVEGQTTARAINAGLRAAARRLSTEEFEEQAYERLLHGAMLGALDSHYELETDEQVDAVELADVKMPRFARLPFAKALEAFLRKKVVTRSVFDRMSDAARRQAFTVANAATTEMLRVFRAELAKEVAAGGQLREFEKRIRDRAESAGWTPSNPSHVETIYRTNVIDSYGAGRAEHARQPEVIEARPYWQIRTVKDSRQRRTHRDVDGYVLRADDPFWKTAFPPFGFNCYLPDTRIAGRIIGASKAPYSGKAIELTTAKGRRLTVTPNHPVLTSKGFVPAGALREGDHLVGYGDQIDTGSEDHEQHDTPRAEDLFRAIADAGDGGASAVSAAAHEFHGEAARFHGEIEIVGSYRQLLLDAQAAGFEYRREFGFVPPHTAAPRASLAIELVGRDSPAAPRGPSASELTLDRPLAFLDAAPLLTLRIGPAAELDVAKREQTGESGTGDACFLGDLLQRYAGAVAFDQIVGVREFDWAGHVYDFESELGWVMAQSLVASNCRCRVSTLSPEQVKRRGLDVRTGSDISGLPDDGFTSGR